MELLNGNGEGEEIVWGEGKWDRGREGVLSEVVLFCFCFFFF